MSTDDKTTTNDETPEVIGPSNPTDEDKPLVLQKEEACIEASDTLEVDLSLHALDAAKNVWAFGKGTFVLKPFIGLAESIVTTVLNSTVGMDLPELETEFIRPNLENLDGALLNPAITSAVNFVHPWFNKTEELVKPVFETVVPRILKPLRIFKAQENIEE